MDKQTIVVDREAGQWVASWFSRDEGKTFRLFGSHNPDLVAAELAKRWGIDNYKVVVC